MPETIIDLDTLVDGPKPKPGDKKPTPIVSCPCGCGTHVPLSMYTDEQISLEFGRRHQRRADPAKRWAKHREGFKGCRCATCKPEWEAQQLRKAELRRVLENHGYEVNQRGGIKWETSPKNDSLRKREE